jgi:hypothetical protein
MGQRGGGEWCAWLRQIGAGWVRGRPRGAWPWELVAFARSEAAAERERAGRPWVFAASTVLRQGEDPGTALRRRRRIAAQTAR